MAISHASEILATLKPRFYFFIWAFFAVEGEVPLLAAGGTEANAHAPLGHNMKKGVMSALVEFTFLKPNSET